MVTLSFTIFFGQKNLNRAHMLFQVLCGFEPIFYTTHPNEEPNYKKNPQRVIEGSYDKNGLPDDFADFAETVFDFIRFYGMGEIFDPSVYGKVKRHQSEYIFCSVTFDEGYKSYYYLTNDDSIEVGDFVIVPAGKDNHEAVVEVVNIEYFNDENAPLPAEKTKRIIRKCTDDDFDPPVE